MIDMTEQLPQQMFEAGKLKHKRLISTMQLFIGFLTAIEIGVLTLFLQKEELFLSKANLFYLIYSIFLAILLSFIGLSSILVNLEKTLGWKPELEEKTKKKKWTWF
ncbi:MAG: hypothetical protein ABIE23_03250 [archaeon]